MGPSMDRALEDQRLEGRHNIFNLNSAAVIINHAPGARRKPEPVTSCGFFGDSQSPGNFLGGKGYLFQVSAYEFPLSVHSIVGIPPQPPASHQVAYLGGSFPQIDPMQLLLMVPRMP